MLGLELITFVENVCERISQVGTLIFAVYLCFMCDIQFSFWSKMIPSILTLSVTNIDIVQWKPRKSNFYENRI